VNLHRHQLDKHDSSSENAVQRCALVVGGQAGKRGRVNPDCARRFTSTDSTEGGSTGDETRAVLEAIAFVKIK